MAATLGAILLPNNVCRGPVPGLPPRPAVIVPTPGTKHFAHVFPPKERFPLEGRSRFTPIASHSALLGPVPRLAYVRPRIRASLSASPRRLQPLPAVESLEIRSATVDEGVRLRIKEPAYGPSFGDGHRCCGIVPPTVEPDKRYRLQPEPPMRAQMVTLSKIPLIARPLIGPRQRTGGCPR